MVQVRTQINTFRGGEYGILMNRRGIFRSRYGCYLDTLTAAFDVLPDRTKTV
jgi:hypothetical protein